MRTALVTVALLTGCSAVAPEAPRGKEPSRIEGGRRDDAHRGVVGLFLMTQQGQGICSGTLILPNLVLTARHCVSPTTGAFVVCGQSPFGAPYPGQSLYATTDSRMTQSSQWYQGAEVFVPAEGNDTCGFDIALLRLRSNVPGTVAPLVPRVDSDPRADELYAAIGFGSTGASQGGTRMILEGLQVRCGPGECQSWDIDGREWLGETGVCQGDSGGPAIDSSGRVIGVVSRGSQGCETPIYGSVSRWKDWILGVARSAVSAGGYPEPDWVRTGCTDEWCGAGPGGAGGEGGAAGQGGGGSSGGGGSGGDPQGRTCTGNDCPQGYLCINPGDGSPFYCTATCSSDAECPDGTRCATDISACLREPAGGAGAPGVGGAGGAAGSGGPAQQALADSSDSGSCSVRAAGPVKPVPWSTGGALAALAAACLGRRRRGWSRGGSNP